MLSTDFVSGSPCWLDLGAPDVAAAAEFYGAVFDWRYHPFDSDSDQYGLLRSGGQVTGAIGKLSEKGARSAWMIYFNTADADATAETVRGLGGEVRVAPFDVDSDARMAQFTDPLGGQFAVWQPGRLPGLEKVDEPNALTWIELYTTDAAEAKRFYSALFGWQTDETELPGGGGSYSLISPSSGDRERMQGGIMELSADYLTLTQGRPYWHPVFRVADCDDTVNRVTSNGGSLQMGPEDAPDVGRLAVCVDPSQADFVVLTPVNA